MSEYIENVVSQTNRLNWTMPFQRMDAFPLDRSSVFSSYDDAVAYASQGEDERGLSGTSYVGQPISVYNAEKSTVDFYVIDADRTLKTVGSAQVTTDGASLTVVDDKLQLYGFNTGYYKYIPAIEDTPSRYEYTTGFKAGLQPRVEAVSAGGESGQTTYRLAWYEPSSETIEDVSAAVDNLSSTVQTIQDSISGASGLNNKVSALETAVGDQESSTGIYGLIAAKADADQVYTKSEVDTKIAEAPHLKRKICESLEDAKTFVESNPTTADQYIYLIPSGLSLEANKYYEYLYREDSTASGGYVLEQIGSWEVNLDDYYTKEQIDTTLENYALASSLTDLVSNDTLNSKLESYVTSDTLNNYVTSDTLANYDTSVTADSKYVAKEEGKSLISDDLITKIEELNPGEDNYIKSVDSQFNVTPEGQLSLNDIAMDKVTGLNDALNSKVTQTYSGEESNIPDRLVNADDEKKLAAIELTAKGELDLTAMNIGNWVTENRDVIGGLLSTSDKSKLDGINAGAEVNFVKSVDTQELNVDGEGKLSLVNPPIITSVSSDFTITEGKQLTLTNEYVTTAAIGDLDSLIHASGVPTSTLVDEVNYLSSRLQWGELS